MGTPSSHSTIQPTFPLRSKRLTSLMEPKPPSIKRVLPPPTANRGPLLGIPLLRMFQQRHRIVISGFICWLFSGTSTAATPTAATGPRPNILLVIADDWSYGHAGMFGCSWVKTPAFDRIAREGVLFRNCFTSNPKCSPSRASLLTGRNTWQLEAASCHYGVFPAKWPVYPDLLESAAYLVGFTGKGWGPGDWKAGGFRRNPAGKQFNQQKLMPPLRGISDIDYAANFREFLKQRRADQPFCFWFGPNEPHRPYEEGSGLRAGKKLSDVNLPPYYPDSDIIRSDLLDYAMEVEWFDKHLGQMLQELEASGELENTLVLVTSDQGMPFPRAKGQVYEEGYHLPLAMRWGKHIIAGRVVEDFINVRDVAPTLLKLAGVEVPPSITGQDFLPQIQNRASGWVDRNRNAMLIGKERHDLGRPHDWGYPVRAIRTPEYLFVRNFAPERWPVSNPETGYSNCDNSPTKTLILSSFDDHYRLCFGLRPAEELYRVDRDSHCIQNLAVKTDQEAAKNKLNARLEQLLRADRDPRILGHGDVFDTYKYVGDRSHSYDAWLKHQR